MLLLVSGATKTVTENAGKPGLGYLLCPHNGTAMDKVKSWGIPYACDNGCFSGFQPGDWFRMIKKVEASGHYPMWVVAPDLWKRAQTTLDLFRVWQPWLVARGFKLAFAAQDGSEKGLIPWQEIDCLFLGGSTEWKTGPIAERLTREAHERGKWVHMGRVNTPKRVGICASWGVDSFDGSSFSVRPSRILEGLEWIKASKQSSKS